MKRIYSKHGMTGTKIHEIWKEMKRRCKHHSKRSSSYDNINFCGEWNESSNFIKWALENGYEEGLQLDRRNNLEGYCPANCRFVTPRVNANNRKNTIYLTYQGITKPLSFWADEIGICYHTLHTRYKRGWAIERILTERINK